MNDLPAGLADVVGAESTITVAVDAALNVLAANDAARAAWYGFAPGANLARAVFTDPRLDEDLKATSAPAAQIVEVLRDGATTHSQNRERLLLIGELMSQSSAFARMWAHPSELTPQGTIVAAAPDGSWLPFRYVISAWEPAPEVRLLRWTATTVWECVEDPS